MRRGDNRAPDTPAQQPATPAGTPPDGAAEDRGASRASRTARTMSVVTYVAVLFVAAFLLLLLTYMMERRENELVREQNETIIGELSESLTGLRESNSAMQSVQNLYADNLTLLDKVDELEDRLAVLEAEQSHLISQLETAEAARLAQERSIKALDWFWQINEAYVRGRYETARSLIASLEEGGLVDALPAQSITDNTRFSPRDRYQEIYDALN